MNIMEAPVIIEVRHNTGVVALNRAKALNSINLEMVNIIQDALNAWETDESIKQVLIYSTSERAFCAGGDIRDLREAVVAGNPEFGDHYFQAEFDLVNHLGTYPKPVIALINGIVMGGGMGVSMHGSHRIITEKALAAMPETAIGYVPDVGFTYFSQQVTTPAIAKFLGITGRRLSPADMLWTGIASHFIRSADVEAFTTTLLQDSLEAALGEFSTQPAEASTLAAQAESIEATFGQKTWALIDAALAAHPDVAFRDEVYQLLRQAAPSAIVATSALMNANREAQDLREGLDNELIMALHMIRQPDFAEGVRAAVVDKDRNPQFGSVRAEEEYAALIKK
ncbi:3-hydroxyisobutyryl-CoA hydrolase [Corynebacterium callunae]|uniref:3-hydroxyisobutyryl-CoA hydrolase n=1 Tax=Corynebacterium callunae TaxID=1721 RepID=UPI00398277F5